MKFADLSPEERAEVDALVHDAYVQADGEVRTHTEAADEFATSLTSAVQDHRDWAGILLDDWRDRGMRAFLQDRWKHAEIFGWIHRGKHRSRTERRGTKRVANDGTHTWVQESLLDWTPDQLRAAIRECRNRIAEEQANIAMYEALLELLRETETYRVRDALDLKGKSLEQYLAERAA